jgi:hypothetical protein
MDTDEINNTSKLNHHMILFIAQICLLAIVVLVSLGNLTFNNGDQNLWMILASSCLGYVLPNPKIKTDKTIKEAKSQEIKIA